MKSEYIHVRIESDTKKLLKELAKAEGRTMSNMVAQLIKQAAKKD